MTRLIAALLFVCCLSGSAEALLFRAGAPPTGGPPPFNYNTVMAKPWMGWSTWEQVGGAPTQAYIEANADALVSSGLLAAGYNVVRPDDGWSNGDRDTNGNLLPNANFPDMKALANYIKADGEIPMAYTDAGTTGCGWPGGSEGHYVQDLTQFLVTWGYQGVMFDSCGIYSEGVDDKVAYYGNILPAINQVGVPAFMEVAPASYAPYIGAFEYGPYTATAWWNGTDAYGTGCTTQGSANFSNMMSTFWGSNSHPGTTGPYHYVKNSILLVGSAILTASEQAVQFAQDSIMSAPLEIGCDVRNLSAASLALLKNPKVISIDQDPWVLGAMKLNYSYANSTEVYAKWTSTSGERVVLMINENTVPENITVTFADIGITGTANVYDILNQASLGTATTTYTASNVPAHGAVYLDLTGFTENPFFCYAFGAGQSGTTAGTNCTWQADHNSQYGTGGFHEGQTQGVGNAINTSGITNPAPQNIYQQARVGQLFPVTGTKQCPFSYDFWNLVPGATYKIRLHFSENWDTAAGQRKFNINLYNGVTNQRVATDFDVYATAGAQYKAVVEEYLEAAPHGNIAIIFSNGSVGCPILSGAEAIKQ